MYVACLRTMTMTVTEIVSWKTRIAVAVAFAVVTNNNSWGYYSTSVVVRKRRRHCAGRRRLLLPPLLAGVYSSNYDSKGSSAWFAAVVTFPSCWISFWAGFWCRIRTGGFLSVYNQTRIAIVIIMIGIWTMLLILSRYVGEGMHIICILNIYIMILRNGEMLSYIAFVVIDFV